MAQRSRDRRRCARPACARPRSCASRSSPSTTASCSAGSASLAATTPEAALLLFVRSSTTDATGDGARRLSSPKETATVTDEPAPTTLAYGGRTVRLKWHKLRQRPERSAVRAMPICAPGLPQAPASRSTCAAWPAAGSSACTMRSSRARPPGRGRSPRSMPRRSPGSRCALRQARRRLLLDELADVVRAGPCAPEARVQLDLKDADLGRASHAWFAAALERGRGRFILSGCDWDAVKRLGGASRAWRWATIRTTMRATTRRQRCAPFAKGRPRPIPSTSIASSCAPPMRRATRWWRSCAHEVIGSTAGRSITATPAAIADLRAALAEGCDQITTNSAAAWAAARL